MYDAAAEAVPMAQSGQNRKKAVVIISDGNDTSSRVGVSEVQAASCAKPKCWSTRSASTGRAQPTFSGRRRRCGSRSRACRFRSRSLAARGGAGAAGSPLPAAIRQRRRRRHVFGRRRRRSRERDGAARDDRRQRRPHGDRARLPRSRSGSGQHRRRIEPAVLPRLSEPGIQGRPLAHDSRRSCAIRR